jgi:hypothetical protein
MIIIGLKLPTDSPPPSGSGVNSYLENFNLVEFVCLGALTEFHIRRDGRCMTGTPGIPVIHAGYKNREKLFNCNDPTCSLLMSANISYNHVSTGQGR